MKIGKCNECTSKFKGVLLLVGFDWTLGSFVSTEHPLTAQHPPCRPRSPNRPTRSWQLRTLPISWQPYWSLGILWPPDTFPANWRPLGQSRPTCLLGDTLATWCPQGHSVLFWPLGRPSGCSTSSGRSDAVLTAWSPPVHWRRPACSAERSPSCLWNS